MLLLYRQLRNPNTSTSQYKSHNLISIHSATEVLRTKPLRLIALAHSVYIASQ